MSFLPVSRAFRRPNLSAIGALAVGVLASSPAKAAYVISETAVRGVVSSSGTSLGAFTLSTGYYAFTNRVTFSDPVAYADALALPPSETSYFLAPVPLTTIRLADGLIDRSAPEGTIITGSYPADGDGPPEGLIVVEFNGPDTDLSNPSTRPYLLLGDVAIGSYKFETLPGATAVRFNISTTSHEPEDELDYTYMVSGTIIFGQDGADDIYNASFSLKSADNHVVIVGKTAGVGVSAIPEPATGVFHLGLAALVAGILVRRPARPRGSCPD